MNGHPRRKGWTARALRLAACLAPFGFANPAGAANAAVEREVAALPAYRPLRLVSGTIRLWGHGSPRTDFMGSLVRAWETGFVRFQPRVSFDDRMYGTASAIGALYAGAGNLAILGEEIFPYEIEAYRHATGSQPTGVEVATGSLDVRNFEFAQMFFVHRDNPLNRMTLAQLDAIFGAEHKRGAPRNFRTWGDLGLTGVWADRPIHLYGWSLDNDFWIFLGERVLGGSHRVNCALKGYSHSPRPDGTIYDAGRQILDALAGDPCGIAVSNIRYLNPSVKPLALAERGGRPYTDATEENLVERTYPLAGSIPAFFNCAPGRPLEPQVEEFLRYLLSREGQEAVVRSGKYLPLSRTVMAAQRARLDAAIRSAGGANAEAKTPPLTAPAPAGALRIWGDNRMEAVLDAWEDGYRRGHPEARFDNRLVSSDTGMAGLYTGKADAAILGREVLPVESMGFAWVLGRRPVAIELATGSLAAPGKSPALAVFVSKDNPLERLNLGQLDALLGCERLRGWPKAVRTWGDLGLTGEWADKPIRVYTYDVRTGSAGFLRAAVLRGSLKWNWDSLAEIGAPGGAPGEDGDADRRIGEAVAADRYGLGIASLNAVDARLKTLKLAETEAGPFEAPTRRNVAARRYPLARPVYAYVDAGPGHPLDSRLRDFLAYAVGPEGQAMAERAGGFLPLEPGLRAEQARKLEAR